MKTLWLLVLLSPSIFAEDFECQKKASEACLVDDFPGAVNRSDGAAFERVVEITKQCFYDQTFRGLDWNLEAGSARDQFHTSGQLSETLNPLLSKLQASHTKFLTDSDQEYWALRSIMSHHLAGAPIRQIGAMFESRNQQWFIKSVFEGSPAFRAGLKRGDEILSADFQAFQPVKSFWKYSGCVSIQVRRHAAEKPRSFCVTPSVESFQQSMLQATTRSIAYFRRGKRKVGYFHLWAGTHSDFQRELAKAATAFQKGADAMILDLRDGFGGAGAEFLDPFFKGVFTKPVFVLTNGGTRSGKETLAYLMKTRKRAILIGTPTAGSYLAGRLFEIIPNKSSLYLAVCGESPSGINLEGVGVAPDITVDWSLPYSHGADAPRQRAIDLALQVRPR